MCELCVFECQTCACIGIVYRRHSVVHIHLSHCSHMKTGALAVGSARFGEGNGTIFAQNVGCMGNESSLANCLRASTAGVGCVHSQDAGVICQG